MSCQPKGFASCFAYHVLHYMGMFTVVELLRLVGAFKCSIMLAPHLKPMHFLHASLIQDVRPFSASLKFICIAS